MTDPRYIGTILYVGLAIFAALLAAGLLMQERRWSVQRTALLWGAEGLILLLDLYLCFGLLPAPLRLPVSLTVGFLSYSAVFIAVSADGFVRTALHIVTALPILLAYRKYGRPLLREVSGFRKRSWKLLSAVSAIYFFLFIALMSRIRLDDGVEPDTLFVFCAAVCTYASVSVLSIGNIFYMRRDAREALVKQKLEYLASYMETVSRAERESRRIRHDKRHHDACIAAMARAGDTDGILRYLEQEQAVAENFPAWCPHPMVNELLRSYAEKAKAAGVAFTAQADTPAQSDVADVDFVAILANLLENGLPAERSVGIDSIVSAAERYQGEVHYKVEAGVCTACVILNP